MAVTSTPRTDLTGQARVCPRATDTNVKMDLINEGVDKIILSQMDMSFMFTYAIGSFISGRLGDSFPQK